MKNSFLVLVISFFSFALAAQADITGKWETGEDNTIVEITEKDGVYKGEIFSSDKEGEEIGRQMIKDVKLDKGKFKGKISPPGMGWKNVEFEREDNTLKVKVSVAFIKKKFKWTKME